MGFGVLGLGFRVLGFWALGLGFRVQYGVIRSYIVPWGSFLSLNPKPQNPDDSCSMSARFLAPDVPGWSLGFRVQTLPLLKLPITFPYNRFLTARLGSVRRGSMG